MGVDRKRHSAVVNILNREHATLQPALSVDRSVPQLVGLSVTLGFFQRLWAVLRLLLLPNCLVGKFHHCPYPPACNLGSRVSGLVFFVFTPFLPNVLTIKKHARRLYLFSLLPPKMNFNDELISIY